MKARTRLLAAIKIWIVIYPSITLLNLLLGQYLSTLPLYLRTFILTISLVPWMVFIAMPLLELLIGNWIKKRGE